MSSASEVLFRQRPARVLLCIALLMPPAAIAGIGSQGDVVDDPLSGAELPPGHAGLNRGRHPDKGHSVLRCFQAGHLIYEAYDVQTSERTAAVIPLPAQSLGGFSVQLIDLKDGTCLVESR